MGGRAPSAEDLGTQADIIALSVSLSLSLWWWRQFSVTLTLSQVGVGSCAWGHRSRVRALRFLAAVGETLYDNCIK